jgi:gluconate 2-dehydrogenase gamma chain
VTRREVLGYAAALGGASFALGACRKPRRPALVPVSAQPGKALTAEEMALCVAATERVLPADQDPGAAQLGVPEYIDRRLARAGHRAMLARNRFRHGLGLLADWSKNHHGGDFLSLDPDKQDVALASLAAEGGDEGYAFVRQLVILTIEGAFADPVYGGNRDRGGWKLVGFDAPCPNPRCH